MSTTDDLRAALRQVRRQSFAALPTPLHLLPRLSAELGREVWIKRDDLTGLALGGNKARKLEYSLAAAPSDTDTVITVGAAQSNHARSTAAAARLMGWPCHLVLGGDRPDRPSGNVLLDVLLGAELHFASSEDWGEFERQASELEFALRSQGRHPIVLPMGGSTANGAAGFVAAYAELLEQCRDRDLQPAAVIHATSTGGTQAGLSFARAVAGIGPEVVGVGVIKASPDLARDIRELHEGLSTILKLEPLQPPTVTILPDYVGNGYAQPTPGAEAAARLLAETEAILTDPVYSAKALHAVVDLARQEPGGAPLIFWHTGGQPALFSEESTPPDWD